MEEITREEERRGMGIWLSYGRIRIGEQSWIWDEGEVVLRDNKSMIRKKGGKVPGERRVKVNGRRESREKGVSRYGEEKRRRGLEGGVLKRGRPS